MAKLSEVQLEQLRTKTVELLLELRRLYLRSPQANMLKHWEILQNRMLSAARRAANPDEWVTSMLRGMQIPSVSSACSAAIVSLGGAVREAGAAREWLDMVEREYGLLLAMARLAAEQARESRERVDPETGEVL
jgi:hypothetical protein